MTSNEGRPAGPNTRNDYEATVLDFLDREMATVQQAQKSTRQSEEVDALVTDLLKQVITETGQPRSADKPLFDEDELFSGLTPGSAKPADAAQDSPLFSVPSAPQKEAAPKETIAAIESPEPVKENAATRTTPGIFGSGMTAISRKFPVKAVAAVAGLVIVLGAAAYFFSGKSGKAPQTQPAAAQVTESVTSAAPVSTQPAAAPVVTAAPNKSNAAPRPVPVAPVKTTARPVTQPQSIKPAPANTKPEPTPAKTANEEKPPVVQPAPPPAPAPASTAVEKPSSQPVAENAAPIIPEKKPAPQVANLVNEPSAPPPAPAPAPAPAAPAVSTNLVPAVPVSQASPVYPELALRTRASGQVVLELQIDDQGKVLKATPVSGPIIFHSAAVAAAMKWRYKPASISGANVRSQSKVTMTFNLKN